MESHLEQLLTEQLLSKAVCLVLWQADVQRGEAAGTSSSDELEGGPMALGGMEGYTQLGVGESSGLCLKSISILQTVYTRETC